MAKNNGHMKLVKLATKLLKNMPNTISTNSVKRLKKTGRTLGKHVISPYFTGISQVVKMEDVKKLQQNIENDPFIRD